MRISILLIIVWAGALCVASCKKDNTNTSTGSSFRKPSGMLLNLDYNGTTWVQNGYLLLDIDHADNKDKQFMIVDVVAEGSGYKFMTKQAPKPIDQLATNWPTEVRQVISGRYFANDFFVSAYMKMKATNSTKPYEFLYDSAHHFTPLSSVILPLNYMLNPIYAGNMAGKDPQASLELWAPGRNTSSGSDPDFEDSTSNYMFYTKNNPVAKPYMLYFYFNEGYFTNVSSPGKGSRPFSNFIYNGGDQINNMKGKIDAAMVLHEDVSTIMFFDFDNWEYYFVKMPCPAVYDAPCNGEIEISPTQSMNSLMTWPEGWGKK